MTISVDKSIIFFIFLLLSESDLWRHFCREAVGVVVAQICIA